MRGYTFQFNRGQGPVVTALSGMGLDRIPWGAGHHEAFRRSFGHTAAISAICEDLPEAHNTVTLDPELKDSDGIPAPRISYTLSENSRRMLDHAMARGTEVMRAAGAWDVNAARRQTHVSLMPTVSAAPGTAGAPPWAGPALKRLPPTPKPARARGGLELR